jgi:hypothetical protein
MNLAAAIAVFDKSADRTRPNAQTEAWAVIRAELMRVMGAPVAIMDSAGCLYGDDRRIGDLKNARIRLVREAAP